MLDVSGYTFVIEKELYEKASPLKVDMTYMGFSVTSSLKLGGGSGCGCSASVLCGYLLRGMREGKWNRIIFAPTGALLSPTTTFQGESIPGICHAVVFSNRKEG